MGDEETFLEKLRQRLVDELCGIAFSNATDYVWVNEDGDLKFVPTGTLLPEKRRAIASIKMGSYGPDVRLYDKNRAIYQVIRLLGLDERGQEIEDLGPRDQLLNERAWEGEAE